MTVLLKRFRVSSSTVRDDLGETNEEERRSFSNLLNGTALFRQGSTRDRKKGPEPGVEIYGLVLKWWRIYVVREGATLINPLEKKEPFDNWKRGTVWGSLGSSESKTTNLTSSTFTSEFSTTLTVWRGLTDRNHITFKRSRCSQGVPSDQTSTEMNETI